MGTEVGVGCDAAVAVGAGVGLGSSPPEQDTANVARIRAAITDASGITLALKIPVKFRSIIYESRTR